MEKDLLYNWKTILLIVCIAGSIWVLSPKYTPKGWTMNMPVGFDIQGGVRAVVKPVDVLSEEQMAQLIMMMQERMNVYGLKDISVKEAVGSDGKNYVVVEAAGMTQTDVESLLAKQGKFEAKIANETIFTGSDVVVDSYRSGVSYESQIGGYNFFVYLKISSSEVMQKFAQVTEKLSEEISLTGGATFLNETLDLYIDGTEVDKLKISSNLKGKLFDSPVVEGAAKTKEDAVKNMQRMQAILQTGALPTKLEVVSVDRVSPKLGEAFVRNILLAAAVVFAAVLVFITLIYKDPWLFVPIIANSLAELLITLGVAVVVKWQLDIPSIAGLITSIGTGVDSEIMMVNEARSGETEEEAEYGLRTNLKRAGFILVSVFGILFSAMLPMMFFSFGAIRGFAITTLLGACVGYFITRPVFLMYLGYYFKTLRVKA